MKAIDIRNGGPPPKHAASKPVVKVANVKVVSVPKPIARRPAIQQRVKVPWPGDQMIPLAWLYTSGASSNRRGVDAINYWATTATQQEIDDMHRRARSMGWLTGFAIGFPVFNTIFGKLFGNR